MIQTHSEIKKQRISIFAGSKTDIHPEYHSIVYNCIDAICKTNRFSFAYGGGYTGIMASIKDACITNDADIIGINCARWKSDHDLQLSKVEYYDTILERQNRLIELGDTFLVCPGGLGTCFEALQVCTLNDIGEMKRKRPILFYNFNGFFNHIKSWISYSRSQGMIMKTNEELDIHFVDTLEDCIEKINSF